MGAVGGFGLEGVEGWGEVVVGFCVGEDGQEGGVVEG